MVDEAAYRRTLSASIYLPCPFEKSIVTHCVECALAGKHNVAEREVVSCDSNTAHARCISLLGLLRENFTFAFGTAHINGPLPHGREMRMQCGGLRGLNHSLDGGSEVTNVAALLDSAEEKFGSVAELPYANLVRYAMSDYKAR